MRLFEADRSDLCAVELFYAQAKKPTSQPTISPLQEYGGTRSRVQNAKCTVHKSNNATLCLYTFSLSLSCLTRGVLTDSPKPIGLSEIQVELLNHYTVNNNFTGYCFSSQQIYSCRNGHVVQLVRARYRANQTTGAVVDINMVDSIRNE